MYREYRALSAAAAVTAMYRELGSRHRARSRSIQIIGIKPIKAGECKRKHMKPHPHSNPGGPSS